MHSTAPERKIGAPVGSGRTGLCVSPFPRFFAPNPAGPAPRNRRKGLQRLPSPAPLRCARLRPARTFSTAPLATAHKEPSLRGSPLPRSLLPSPASITKLCPRPLLVGEGPPFPKRRARRACVSPLSPPLKKGSLSAQLCPARQRLRSFSRHKAKTMGVIGGWKIRNQREMYGLDDLWITRVPWHEKCKNIYSP